LRNQSLRAPGKSRLEPRTNSPKSRVGVDPLQRTPSHYRRKDSTCPRDTKTRTPLQFRARIVELARAGRSPKELAEEFEPSEQTIRNWIARADRDEGRRSDGMTSDEREELRRLRRENKQLKVEREILKKAAAWFARESDSVPPKDSSS
jgi:transposase